MPLIKNNVCNSFKNQFFFMYISVVYLQCIIFVTFLCLDDILYSTVSLIASYFVVENTYFIVFI